MDSNKEILRYVVRGDEEKACIDEDFFLICEINVFSDMSIDATVLTREKKHA